MQEKLKLKCAVYTRVSTDNQAEVEFNSCEAQEAKIKSFIKSQENMEVFKVYSDAGFTGANLNRPALAELFSDIEQSKINLVISYKIDRLTRSPRDFYQLIELLEKYQVDFISVTERFDTSTPSGRLLRNIMLTFAQFERELASERTKDKLHQRALKGMWNGGVIPFGYKTEDKKLIINRKEAKIVRDIFDSYVAGGSLAKVYESFKRQKIKDRKGWLFSKGGIDYILTNIIYTGKIKYGGKLSEGIHEPIISEKIFNLAQEIHKKKVRKLRLYKDYLLAGLVKCEECGSYMTPCHTNKYKENKMRRYYYYRCTSTFKRDWNSCGTRLVNANRLEDYIFENLKRVSQDEHYIDSLIFKLNNSPAGDRIGLEPLESCSESAKISPEIFAQTLQHFVKILPEKKGIEKNLWAKKFIKNIIYSKSHIKINLLNPSFSKDYKDFEDFDFNSFGEKNACAPQGAQKTKGKIHKEFSPSNSDFLVRNLRNGSPN
jgi:site-specific DNA recombinase